MLQYQEFFNNPKRHFIKKEKFVAKWGFPKEIGLKDDESFLDRFLKGIDKMDYVFDYTNEIVHNTLLNKYLHQSLWGKSLSENERLSVKTKGMQKSIVNKYKNLIDRGTLEDDSRTLYSFSDSTGSYEIDALLHLTLDGKDYYVMIDFKSNRKDRKDIDRFRKTNIYKKYMRRGTVYTVAAQPDYNISPCDVSDTDLTDAYMPENVLGFLEEVREEKVHHHRKESKFNRNINHSRQHPGSFRPANT